MAKTKCRVSGFGPFGFMAQGATWAEKYGCVCLGVLLIISCSCGLAEKVLMACRPASIDCAVFLTKQEDTKPQHYHGETSS